MSVDLSYQVCDYILKSIAKVPVFLFLTRLGVFGSQYNKINRNDDETIDVEHVSYFLYDVSTIRRKSEKGVKVDKYYTLRPQINH